MNLKDTRKLEELPKCMGISFWWKSLQIEGETREEQVQKQRNLGHDGRVRHRAEWEILDPQDREWETNTSCACDQKKKKTKLTSSSTGIVMVRTREIWRRWKPETVFPETRGGAGLWEQRTTSRGLRCHQAGKNAGVTSVRDPEKPDEPEETGRGTLCHSSKDWRRDCCLQSHRSRCGKRCRRRFHGDNNVSVGSSWGQTWFDKCTEETLRCLWRNDYVTERESLDPCELREIPNTDVGSWNDKRSALPLIQLIVRLRPTHAKAVLE